MRARGDAPEVPRALPGRFSVRRSHQRDQTPQRLIDRAGVLKHGANIRLKQYGPVLAREVLDGYRRPLGRAWQDRCPFTHRVARA